MDCGPLLCGCGSGSCLKVDVFCNLGEKFVGFFFFLEDGFKHGYMIVFAEDAGPGAESAVDGNLMMLDLLT